MIGVYGMGGCGKTTLVTEVGKMAEKSKMFDKVIIIRVSQTPNIKGIQGQMASQLRFKLDEYSEDERAQRLLLRNSTEKKRILVIVDDLWDKFDLNHIGFRFDILNKGTWKILVTARNQSVCTSMDCQKNIHLGLLSEEESWTLFQHHAKIDDKFSESLKGVARKLCEECTGLPIAIETVASSLLSLPSSTQLLTNVGTLRLNGLELGDISFIASLIALEVLDLRRCNFNELPDEIGRLGRLKLLDLSRCRISQNNYNGAIGKCSQLEEFYASEYDRKVEYLHQSIMDIVTLPKLQRFVIQTTGQSIPHHIKSTRFLGLMDFKISKLRKSEKNILQVAESVVLSGLHGGYKNIVPDIDGIVGGMNDLANLSLVNCPEIEYIFDTTSSSKVNYLMPRLVKLLLEKMKNLKELCLGQPLQVLRYFEKLEILQIEDCMQLHNIFPRECNLKNLKNLTIRGCMSAEVLFPTSVGQSLRQLERLVIHECVELKYIIASGREHGGCHTSKEIVPALSPSNSHSPMPSLRTVHVYDCQKLEMIFPVCYVEGLERLQELKIWESPLLNYVFGECDHEYHSSHQYQNHIMLPRLEALQLIHLQNLVGMYPEYCHAKWPSQSLRNLFVKSCPKLDTSWIAVMTGSYQRQYRLNENLSLKLQKLALFGLPQLGRTPWQMWNIQFLQHLKLDKCERLKCLFSVELCGSLQELMYLFIDNCPQLEQIVAANEEPLQLLNTEVYFPKLEKIEVKRCNKLKSLFPVTMVRMLPQLSIIKISEATQLEVVFRHDNGDNTINQTELVLPNLTEIELSYLPSFVDICQGCELQAVKLQQLRIHEFPTIAPSLKAIQVKLEKERRIRLVPSADDDDNVNEDVHSHSSAD